MTARDETTYCGGAHAMTAVARACDELEEEKSAVPMNGGGGSMALGDNEAKEDEDAFGWRPHVDAETNQRCFVHSYTGEVRWSPNAPCADAARSSAFAHAGHPNDGPWGPFHAHMVMLPNGIMPIQPPSSQLDSWRAGYARYPLHCTSSALLGDVTLPEGQLQDGMELERRVLPPTWEDSPHGPPFLEPFPVAILLPQWAHEPRPATGLWNMAPDDQSWWPTAPCFFPTQPPPEFDYIAPLQYLPTPQAWFPEASHVTDQVAGASQFIEKAHNRRGYEIRQARRLMKELGIQPKKPKRHSSPETTRANSHDHQYCNLDIEGRQPPTFVGDRHRVHAASSAIRAN